MTRSQEVLLLTVARIMRARLHNEFYIEFRSAQADDLRALNDALAPFDPSPAQKEILNQFEEKRQEKFLGDLAASGIRKGGGY